MTFSPSCVLFSCVKLHSTAADLKDCSRNSIRLFLALSVELEGVPPEPARPPGAALGLGELASLADASGALAGGGEAAELPVLHDGAAHPVDLGVARDGLVVRVDHDHLEVLVSGVLSDPVRVEDAKPLEPSSDTFLGDGALAAAATHGDAVDDEALLVLVAEAPGLVG